MDDVVEISGLENACRLCLTTEQTRSSIFGVPHVSIPFAEKIRSCLSIQISANDKLSTLVCATCIKNVNHWHTYKDTCLKSQERLQQWLTKQNIVPPIVTVKEEPVDVEFQDDNMQISTNDSNCVNIPSSVENSTAQSADNSSSIANTAVEALQNHKDSERFDRDHFPVLQVKTEPLDTEDEDDCNLDVESINSGELLINPLAVGVVNSVNNDRIMEADSTQKFKTKKYGKKRFRRGPHTHFRGARVFKKKCIHCKIFLHSKYSYQQHMSRYHGIVNNVVPAVVGQTKQKSKLTEHTSNMEAEDIADFSPEDAEFIKMIKTDPLTPVQKSIISQLKTFSCYSCKQTFLDRRQTLNHIRQHMRDLRPFTCIACLTEFSDRSMYKLHCGASFECAMKIALVVPKVGPEKYFTCNMCLKPLNNRQELLAHLAMHSDKQNKDLRPPPKLKPITPTTTSRIDASPSRRSISNVAGPYMKGDPAHNHMCDLCGMIYRYKPNMIKHRELCLTLPENTRTSYRCIHCSMTYLVFKKFYLHVIYEHKRQEITCFTCHEKFTSGDEYQVHHESHRGIANSENADKNINDISQNSNAMDEEPSDASQNSMDVSGKPFNCALCGENFATKSELTEHRNLHLKVKIYSCVICRSMFSSSGALESHMKDHGIADASEQNSNSLSVEYGRGHRSQNSSLNESSLSATSDPGGRFNHCYQCGKNFSNYANLKRHERNLHIKVRRRWSCHDCKRRFKSEEAYNEHLTLDHSSEPQLQQSASNTPPVQPQVSTSTGKPMMQCPKCPKTFTYQGNLILHCQNVHKENHFERTKTVPAPPVRRSAPPLSRILPAARGHSCNVCGKTFREEQSLKTHRGWHLRSNYKLKADKNTSLNENLMTGPGYTLNLASTPKPAKARKSFPNNPSQKQLNLIGTLQCQVCDDRFSDVAELRKHLWDIHCARNKPEKNFASELQCELCTNKFADEESLTAHMQWHSENPILSSVNSNTGNINSIVQETNSIISEQTKKNFHCDVCGKYYSNRKLFLRHKKLHKVLPVSTMMNFQSLQNKRHYCVVCQKNFANDASLKRHKASPCHLSNVRAQTAVPMKKITTTALVHQPPDGDMDLTTIKKEPGVEDEAPSLPTPAPATASAPAPAPAPKKRPVTCHICRMIFPNMSVLYQHKQLVHKVHPSKDRLGAQSTNECVPLLSPEGLVCCNLCGKQFPGISNLKQHFSHKHKVKTASFPCTAPGCKLVFSSANSLKSHELTHSSIMFNCHMCDKHVFSKVAITKHMSAMHKAIYQSGVVKNTLWTETDLATYSVKNCQSTACPKCKVKYPNLRALKIHYIKFHENGL